MITTRKHPVQLTPEDRAAVIARILATVPAEGPVWSGSVAGMPVTLARSQWQALRGEKRRTLDRKRRAAGKGVAA